MSLRIDKYMWCVRLAKTRSQATELIKKGKVRLNTDEVKPSREVKIGDTINISKHSAIYSFKILDLLEKRVGAKLVENYLMDITSEEEIQKFKVYQESQKVYRHFGSGKPTKKDRRDLEDFLDWD
jgi:ribosome-associated heat shock protein Hsp15